jgi:hypothetical protein
LGEAAALEGMSRRRLSPHAPARPPAHQRITRPGRWRDPRRGLGTAWPLAAGHHGRRVHPRAARRRARLEPEAGSADPAYDTPCRRQAPSRPYERRNDPAGHTAWRRSSPAWTRTRNPAIHSSLTPGSARSVEVCPVLAPVPRRTATSELSDRATAQPGWTAGSGGGVGATSREFISRPSSHSAAAPCAPRVALALVTA